MTTIETAGQGAFGIAPFIEANDEGVSIGMTLSQYFDPMLNNAADITNGITIEESYMQKRSDRLLALNCRHKSMKNDIQRTQTHAMPDANGVVHSS